MSTIYKPGFLEVIFGPMKSGKSEQIIRIFKMLDFSDINYIVFKPSVNTREKGIASRTFNITLDAINIDEKHPKQIYDHLKGSNYRIIGIDEAQFFDISLVEIIDDLLKKEYHIIITGLMLSFRGEPFGPMPWLVGRANIIKRLTAICEVPSCNRIATRTQRLINGKPAPYNSPLVLIEGLKQSEKYEARCFFHHEVPR